MVPDIMAGFDLDTDIVLECSHDGGNTWNTPRGRTLVQDPERRYIWRRNGRFDRFVVFRFSTRSSRDISIGQLTITVEGGES